MHRGGGNGKGRRSGGNGRLRAIVAPDCPNLHRLLRAHAAESSGIITAGAERSAY